MFSRIQGQAYQYSVLLQTVNDECSLWEMAGAVNLQEFLLGLFPHLPRLGWSWSCYFCGMSLNFLVGVWVCFCTQVLVLNRTHLTLFSLNEMTCSTPASFKKKSFCQLHNFSYTLGNLLVAIATLHFFCLYNEIMSFFTDKINFPIQL